MWLNLILLCGHAHADVCKTVCYSTFTFVKFWCIVSAWVIVTQSL